MGLEAPVAVDLGRQLGRQGGNQAPVIADLELGQQHEGQLRDRRRFVIQTDPTVLAHRPFQAAQVIAGLGHQPGPSLDPGSVGQSGATEPESQSVGKRLVASGERTRGNVVAAGVANQQAGQTLELGIHRRGRLAARQAVAHRTHAAGVGQCAHHVIAGPMIRRPGDPGLVDDLVDELPGREIVGHGHRRQQQRPPGALAHLQGLFGETGRTYHPIGIGFTDLEAVRQDRHRDGQGSRIKPLGGREAGSSRAATAYCSRAAHQGLGGRPCSQ